MKKRLLAILLSLMMVLSLLPVGVFAADAEGTGTGEELSKLFTDVHAGESSSGNVTVTIDKDYDLTDYQWKSLTVQGYTGAGVVTVEGNNHKITGLNAPLFAGGFAGTSGIVVKNLTLTNVTINDSTSDQGIGAFINNVDSMPTIELDNCHLTDSKITSTGGARVGGLIGWTSGYNKKDDGPVDTYITVKNCSVENTEITAKGSVGGIIGHAGCNPATFHTFTDNTVTGCTLNSTDADGWRVGVVVGTANVGEVALNNTTESGNTVTQTGKTAPAGQSNLYGRFVPNATGKLVIDGVAVFNSDIVAAIGNTGYKTLPEAVVAAKDGDTITLLKDTAVSTMITLKKSLTLDLNGHKLNAEGNTASWVQVVDNAKLTINGTVEGSAAYGRMNLGIATNNNGSLEINGGIYAVGDEQTVLHINGTCMSSNVTINGATIKATNDNGIQLNGKGTFSITNSEITGGTGIYIKAGTLTLENTKVTGTLTPVNYAYNGNGSNATGDAVVIDACNYPGGNPAITIKSGEFTGSKAAIGYYRHSGSNSAATPGTATITITGGTFSSDPSAYVPATHHVEENGTYTVKEGAAEVKADINVTATTNAAVSGTIKDEDKTKIEEVKDKVNVDGVDKAIREERKVDIVAAAGVTAADISDASKTIVAEINVKVEAKAADFAKGQLTFAATPVATVKVNNVAQEKTVPVTNDMLNGKPITVKLPLPTVDGKLFTPKQIKHTSADGSVEYFLDHSENGAGVFKIENDCAVFTITKFSTFELSGTQTYVAPVYTSAPITKKDVKFDDVDVNAYYAPAVKWAVENKITAGKTDKLFAPDDTCTRGEMITFLWNAAGKPAAKNTANPFTDVNVGAFYYDAVLWAVENGITSGTTETTFSPDKTVNRAQVVAFLYNYANKPAAANSTFSDVAADAYYAPAVGWAAAQKITSGTGNNTFSPENDCTRAQIVTFLYNDLAK